MIGTVTPPDGKTFDMWVVYEHPKDHPDKYVARRWVHVPPNMVAASIVEFAVADTEEELAEALIAVGRVSLGAMDMDDPVIVEVWI